MANAADAPAAPSAGNCKSHKAVAPQFPRQGIFRPITVMQARHQEPDGGRKGNELLPAFLSPNRGSTLPWLSPQYVAADAMKSLTFFAVEDSSIGHGKCDE